MREQTFFHSKIAKTKESDSKEIAPMSKAKCMVLRHKNMSSLKKKIGSLVKHCRKKCTL